MAGWKDKLAETARKNRVEIVDAKLTRRDLFKMGLLTSGGFLVAKMGLSSRAAGAGGSVVSPKTTPWIEELPIPPVAKPLTCDEMVAVSGRPAPTQACNTAAGEASRANGHQHWDCFDAANMDFYCNNNQVQQASWHRELPKDEVWLFNGMFPGPRIHAQYNRPVMIRFCNNLPSLADHKGYGRPTPTTHLHNGHTESESDGNPMDTFDTARYHDSFYLNRRAGFTDPQFGAGPVNNGDVRETMTTLWYHDHCLDFTSQNVYRGNMGLYYLFNEFDTGNENDPNPQAWRLPSGDFDVPLVFHDRVFDPQGKGYFDLFNLDGIIGDKYTVNGKIQPFMRVARRKYRFRMLNIGTSRFYNFFLSNGQSMVQCSHDGNMLPRPLTVKNIRFTVASRVDAIIDFSKLPSGTELYLVNCCEQKDGRGPTGKLLPVALGDKVLKFIVQAPEANAPDIRKGQEIRFGVDAFPGRAFKGSVFLISPQVSAATRMFSLGALVTNADLALKANTFARGEVVLERDVPTVLAPLDAIVTSSGFSRVFVVSNNIALSRDVVVGRIRGDRQEILKGLAAGETLAVSGLNKLRDGAAVTVRPNAR